MIEITREDLIKAFKLWTKLYAEEGDTSKSEKNTEDYEIESADYMIWLLNEVKK